MKILLFLLLCTFKVHAATYYISASSGDDARSAIQAQKSATPWKTLAQLNRSWNNIAPGDSILLRRGDVFYGSLIVRKSGMEGAPIYIGAYGSGPKPVISGFQQVLSWRPVQGNVHESREPVSALSALNMVTINDRLVPMGRYPNRTAHNKGYLTVDGHEGKNVLSGDALNAAKTDWTGAGVVVRTKHYSLDAGNIISHSKNTVVFQPAAEYEIADRYGYFIQNDIRTLDQEGEWYFNPATGKLSIFFSKNPALYTVKASAIDTLVQCKDADYINFENLRLEGANKWAFFHHSAAYNVVRNCDIQFCGDAGIKAAQKGNTGFTATGNFIADANNFGIDARSIAADISIQHNTLKRIGIFEDAGGRGAHSRTAIIINTGSDHDIAYNRIDSVGYAGIRWNGNNTQIHHNYITNFALVLDDCGGIYTGNSNKGRQQARKVYNNIVLHGIGAAAGTAGKANQASGIYHDDNSEEIETYNNVVAFMGDAGIYHHNNRNMNTHHNLVYDCGDALAQLVHDNAKHWPMQNMLFRNNTLVASTPKQWLLKYFNKTDSLAIAAVNNGQKTGIDNNRYLRPANPDGPGVYVIWDVYSGKGVEQRRHYTLKDWARNFGHDENSSVIPALFRRGGDAKEVIRFWYNPTNEKMVIKETGDYVDVDGKPYPKGAIQLAPYSGLVLFRRP